MEWMLLPLRRYAEFSGRSRRMEYWMFFLFQFLLYIAFYVLMFVLIGGSALMMMGRSDPSSAGAGAAAVGGGVLILSLLFLLVWLGMLISSLAVGVRRLHDTDRSGWWIVAPLAGYLIAIVGVVARSQALTLIGGLAAFGLFITLLVFYFLDGTPGTNRFGPDPKNRVEANVFA